MTRSAALHRSGRTLSQAGSQAASSGSLARSLTERDIVGEVLRRHFRGEAGRNRSSPITRPPRGPAPQMAANLSDECANIWLNGALLSSSDSAPEGTRSRHRPRGDVVAGW